MQSVNILVSHSQEIDTTNASAYWLMGTAHTPLSSSFRDHPQTTPKPELENGAHRELEVPGKSSSELGSLLNRLLGLKPSSVSPQARNTRGSPH